MDYYRKNKGGASPHPPKKLGGPPVRRPDTAARAAAQKKASHPTGPLASALKLLTAIARHQFMRRGLRVYVCADFTSKKLVCLAQDSKYADVAAAAVKVIAEAMTCLDTVDQENSKLIRQMKYEIEYPTVPQEA